jgi:uncharacterized protein
VLDHLWVNREAREPTLVVIDEAHNICSARPSDPLLAATTQRLIQIAGEGRKFGLGSSSPPRARYASLVVSCRRR